MSDHVPAAQIPVPVAWRRDADALRHDDAWLSAEWLTTDGLGGYACGTAADVATRRYHGWLIAQPAGLDRRHLFLPRCDQFLEAGGRRHALGAGHWRSAAAPEGPMCRRSFGLLPYPAWEWQTDGGTLRRELLQPAGRRAVLVRWSWTGREPVGLGLRPLLACRPADALTFANDAADLSPRRQGAALGFQPYPSLPALWATADRPLAFATDPVWYRGNLYTADADRGYDAVEDHACPGEWTLTLVPGEPLVIAFALQEPVADPAGAFAAAAAQGAHRWQAALAATDGDSRWAHLWCTADDFLYRTTTGRRGILAGFPWFGEWGRDVFLALPGLTLGRCDLAGCAEVLTGALPFLQHGVLPNVYGDTPATSHYDSADAALWFARAVLLYDRAGGDPQLLEQRLLPALEGIVAAYRAGAPLGLRATADGLLQGGAADQNATWMDANTRAGPVTPRDGEPVELNALWCSLLAHLAQLRQRFGGPKAARRWRDAAARSAVAFASRFWLTEGAYLADRWHGGGPDRAVRPNMVLAAALELAPLSRAQRACVVGKATAELLTPVGLRTLAPRDPAYRPRYGGGPEERDAAYHQGTAWPWLLGSYVEAALRGASPQDLPRVREGLRGLLAGVVAEVDRAGLGHVSEVFDGDPPQRPGGTFAQAWNTGELLRARQLLRTAEETP